MAKLRAAFALLALFAQGALCGIDQIRIHGPQAVNLWKLNAARARSQATSNAGLLVQVDGMGDVDAVTDRILAALPQS